MRRILQCDLCMFFFNFIMHFWFGATFTEVQFMVWKIRYSFFLKPKLPKLYDYSLTFPSTIYSIY